MCHIDIAFDAQKFVNTLRLALKEHYIIGTIKQWSSSENEQSGCSVHVLRHVLTRYFTQCLNDVVKKKLDILWIKLFIRHAANWYLLAANFVLTVAHWKCLLGCQLMLTVIFPVHMCKGT